MASALKLTDKSRHKIYEQTSLAYHTLDELLRISDGVEYYFVQDYPIQNGNTVDWAIVPDDLFHENFFFPVSRNVQESETEFVIIHEVM